MPQHKVKLIVNPNADMGQAWRNAADLRPVVEEFGGADWTGTVYPTHATELARQAAQEGYELIISAGGDGTAHEVINGLMQVSPERRPRLGIVPLGSGNDFSHAVGMNPQPALAMRQIFTGKPKRIDIGKMVEAHGRTEYMNNTLGIGFDATVTIRSHQLSNVHGFLMYFVAVLQTILFNHDAPKMQIQTDAESWEDETMMLTICNGPREGGGFLVAPEARIDDGVYHYAAIRHISRPMMLRLLPEVMKGTHGRFKVVRMGQCKKLELKSEKPLVIHVDGEVYAGFGTDIRQFSIELLPGALEIMV
jgi:diacylglycerol kinase (ATP)